MGRSQQRAIRSVEALRGPNERPWIDAAISIIDGDAAMRVETPAQPGKEATGGRHEPGAVRQTVTATGDPIDPPTDNLMEEVLRRERPL